MTDLEYDFGGRLFTINRAYDRLMRNFCARSGLYNGQPRVLTVINDNPGCSLSELSQLTGLGMPSLSVSVKNLRKAGLVAPESVPSTGLRLTDSGVEKAQRFHELFYAFVCSCEETLGTEGFREIYDTLGRMEAIMRRETGD